MYNRNFSDIQEDLIALAVSAAQGQTLHDRLYQAMLAIVYAFDTSPLYRNAYADNPVISADTDKERKSWGQVLSEICHAVGLENPVPMVVFEFWSVGDSAPVQRKIRKRRESERGYGRDGNHAPSYR